MAQSILFIPDISGFTKFVKSTEISHGKHIIEELIDIIIDKGSEVFELAEIEGDAVFFHTEKRISTEQVIQQAEKVFVAFHQQIKKYEYARICNCGACTTAVDLKLKFVVHAGEITFAKFGSQKKAKPYGDPVITAHRLLKNDIELDEYILFSDDFLQDSSLELDGKGKKHDESLGEIDYHYLTIDHWRSQLVVDREDVKNEKTDIEIRVTKNIDLDLDTLYQFIADFKYRHLWNKKASEIVFDTDEINQAGTQHLCIVDGKNLDFNTIKPGREDEISYGEVLKNPAPLKYVENDFFLTPYNINETTVTFIMKASVKWKIQFLMLPILKRVLKKQANVVVNSLALAVKQNEQLIQKELVDEIKEDGLAVSA
ncbi:MAG: DUF2652 domain-containing protein [Bacteroidota bacterium]